MRQGCPLSPLIFLLDANALNVLFTQAIDKSIIKGVYVEEAGEQVTHGQYADDTNVILEAKRQYIDATFEIFRLLGRAFGLFVKEVGVQAVLIPSQLVP